MKKTVHILLLLLGMVVFTSCTTAKKMSYFQNLDKVDLTQPTSLYDAKIMPKDMLSIGVHTLTVEASEAFNIESSYLVDNDGNVNIPATGWYKHHIVFSGNGTTWDFNFISNNNNDLSGTYTIIELDNLLNNNVLIPSIGGMVSTPTRSILISIDIDQEIHLASIARGEVYDVSFGESVTLEDTVEEL